MPERLECEPTIKALYKFTYLYLFEIKRDIGRKTPIFSYPLYLTCTIPYNPFNFYRATRMHSADYAVARCQCLSVRPPVCLSVTRRYSVDTAEHILKVFSPSGCSNIPHQTGWQYSDGDPLMGASNARGYKNHDFRPISRFVSETMQNRAIVTMKGEQETACKLSMNGTSPNNRE